MHDEGQDAVIGFLADPSTHGGEAVERLSTHAAHVFLAGDKAYKLKRAVRLPFLDFSSPEKRRAALEAELSLNRPAAPGLYLAVRAIRRDGRGRPTFSGKGEAMDWVLVMRRFDQDALLDAIARDHAVSPGMMDSLADTVAAMHRAAPPVRRAEGSHFTGMALDCIAALRGTGVNQESVARLEAEVARQCSLHGGHLDRRARDGFVRRCHGDLHLRNIVLMNGRPVPFDALEFSDDLATGDVYYDLAFLIMDLDHRDMRAFANRVLNRYVLAGGDFDGLRSLPLFVAVRAAIRARVAVMSAAVADDAPARRGLIAEAEAYVDLANSYLPPAKPRIIAIGGLSGTGKSTCAVHLAGLVPPAPGALVLRSDVMRKHLAGVAETARLDRGAYTPEESTKVYRALMTAAGRAAEAGHSVIVDAAFAQPSERDAVMEVARRHGVPFTGLWLETPLSVRRNRVRHRISDASDADVAVVDRQESYDLGTMEWFRVDATGTIMETCSQAIDILTLAAVPGRKMPDAPPTP